MHLRQITHLKALAFVENERVSVCNLRQIKEDTGLKGKDKSERKAGQSKQETALCQNPTVTLSINA